MSIRQTQSQYAHGLRSKLGCPLDIEKLADFFGSDEVPAAVIDYRDARDMDEYTRLKRFFDFRDV